MVRQKKSAGPCVLVVLDGWGYSEDAHCNAIAQARTPVWDRLWAEYPHTLIQGSGAYVGLPEDQMGNSEVGHLNLGAGRVVYQEFTRIERAIETGEFAANEVLRAALDQAAASGKAVHILGLLSPGGVHSHQSHIEAMVRAAVAKVGPQVYLHAFLDGRDTPPRSATRYLSEMEQVFEEAGGGGIASIVGRYYAMDRDKRWERTRLAYDLVAHGEAEHEATGAGAALEQAYRRGENDEFVLPTRIVPPDGGRIRVNDGDVMIYMNFRADRARQLTRAFVDDAFDGFDRGARPRPDRFVTLTDYSRDFDVPVAFPPKSLENVFGEYIARHGMRQLRIAETEKYAHVTFFFNGGEEKEFEGEERVLVPSARVATYDLKPEMSAPEVTDKLVRAVEGGRFDVIICNYANPDMVGHSGNFDATVDAIEALDGCVGRVYEAVRGAGGDLLITADHGNAEQMCDESTGQQHTAHTANPVPFIYVGRPARVVKELGALSDVAPTMLYLMGLERPAEMEGRPLIELDPPE